MSGKPPFTDSENSEDYEYLRNQAKSCIAKVMGRSTSISEAGFERGSLIDASFKIPKPENLKFIHPVHQAMLEHSLPPHVNLLSESGVSTNQKPENSEPSQDENELLVEAWESEIFPKITRRFRNEADRQEGFEQIRGALRFGMADIARETVEFLYQDFGGLPSHIKFPTLEDIKKNQKKLERNFFDVFHNI